MTVVGAQSVLLQWQSDWQYSPNPVERYFADDGLLAVRLSVLVIAVYFALLIVRLLDRGFPKDDTSPTSNPTPPATASPAKLVAKSTWWMNAEQKRAYEAEQLAAEIERIEKQAELTRKATDLLDAEAAYAEALSFAQPQPAAAPLAPEVRVPALSLREIHQLIDLAGLPAEYRERLLALATANIEDKLS